MTNGSEMVRSATAQIEREGFDSKEIERRNETSTSATVAQARAEIEARYVVAMQRPRDQDNVRVRLLKECGRSSFAARAYYSLPRGDKPGRITGRPNTIEGLSVRFAEAAIRVSGNVLQQTRTTYDDDFKRMLTVACSDLETNAVYTRDLIVTKTIERRSPKDKAVILGKRTNSAGIEVYIVQTTDDELLQKEGAMVSKAFRTLALRLVPADILEECEHQIAETVRSEIAKDPEGERKRIADGFAPLGILPSDLKDYLGHELAACSPAQLMHLRGLYSAIRDGEVTWSEVLAETEQKRAASTAEGAGAEKKSAGASVAEKIAARTAASEEKRKAGAAPAAAAAAPASTPEASSPSPAAAAKSLEHDPETGEVVPSPEELAAAKAPPASPPASPAASDEQLDKLRAQKAQKPGPSKKREREPGED